MTTQINEKPKCQPTPNKNSHNLLSLKSAQVISISNQQLILPVFMAQIQWILWMHNKNNWKKVLWTDISFSCKKLWLPNRITESEFRLDANKCCKNTWNDAE